MTGPYRCPRPSPRRRPVWLLLALAAGLGLAAPAPAREPLPAGTRFRDCSRCPEMVVVPPGRFVMGATAEEEAAAEVPPVLRGRAGPPHEVTIARSFAIARFEITNDDWAACRDTDHCDGHGHDLRRDRRLHPLTRPTWADARAYADWLSDWTKQPYRLASEAEWEYSARAGTTTLRPWGDALGSNRANCVGCGSAWDGRGPAPVGSFAANRFGLFDMLGNVSEWVEDCWRADYRGAPADGAAVEDAAGCALRVVRGGAWASPPWNLRSARRAGVPADFRHLMIGFRVVRDLDPALVPVPPPP